MKNVSTDEDPNLNILGLRNCPAPDFELDWVNQPKAPGEAL